MRPSALVAACHSAACRPPGSGGTGGSSGQGVRVPVGKLEHGEVFTNANWYGDDPNSSKWLSFWVESKSGNRIAELTLTPIPLKGHAVVSVGVDPQYRRKGLATDLYRIADEAIGGTTFYHSGDSMSKAAKSLFKTLPGSNHVFEELSVVAACHSAACVS